MRQLFEVLKITVEVSGSVGYAAVASKKVDVTGRSVGIILTGGNVDLERLPWST